MTAQIISGTQLASQIKSNVAQQISQYVAQGKRAPSLAVILVGADPASQVYVGSKRKSCTEIGITSKSYDLPKTTTEQALLELIDELNQDNTVDGILVQLPLPKHIDEDRVISAILREKDVDGFHPLNVAGLWSNTPCVVPCTPKGVIKLLKSQNIEIKGKNVVVIGRSNIVGLPVSKLLLNENATVPITHSKKQNLPQVCSQADILVVAIGRAKFVTPDFIKQGAVVIDVGVNRDNTTGKLCGDVDFEACAPKTSYITKVPGGVGPMTICCLIENTIECFLSKF